MFWSLIILLRITYFPKIKKKILKINSVFLTQNVPYFQDQTAGVNRERQLEQLLS